MTRTWQEEEEEKSLDKAHIPRFHRVREFYGVQHGQIKQRGSTHSARYLGFFVFILDIHGWVGTQTRKCLGHA